MAKKSYIGIDSKAKQVKKWYFGVDGKARKVKKGYIGVGGVARPFMSSDPIYYGTIAPLTDARSELTGASVGSYALFAGGYNKTDYSYASTYRDTVEAYSSSLARTTRTALQQARKGIAGVSVGNYALFAGGGQYYNGDFTKEYQKIVDAYSVSLTRSSPTELSDYGGSIRGVSLGGLAIFSFGTSGIVNAYNSSLVRTTGTSTGSSCLAATSNKQYALFYCTNGTYKYVYAYSPTLVRTSIDTTSGIREDYERTGLVGTSAGNYGLFAGGEQGSSVIYLSKVEAYSSSLVKTTPTALSVGRDELTGISLNGFAIFSGGYYYDGGSKRSSDTDIYNETLVKNTLQSLSQGREQLASATVGNYAIIAGGLSAEKQYSSVVDVYAI